MKPGDREYLAQRLNEARRGVQRPKVMGTNRSVKTCSHCGKSGLDKTIEVRMPNGAVAYFGSECVDQIRKLNQVEAEANYRITVGNPIVSSPNDGADDGSDGEDEGEDGEEGEGEEGDEGDYEGDEDDGGDGEDGDSDDEGDEDGADGNDAGANPYRDGSPINPYADPNNPYTAKGFGNYYAAIDPLPHAEAPLSIDNFDKRFQIGDVILDSMHGSGATGNNANIRYMGFGVLMLPKKFISLVLPLNGVYDTSVKFLMDHKLDPGWGPPMLYVDLVKGIVVGHEGRHRVTAFSRVHPGKPILVHMLSQSNPEIRARSITKEMLKKAKNGLFSQEYHNLNEEERSDPNQKKAKFVSGPLFSTVFLGSQQIDV